MPDDHYAELSAAVERLGLANRAMTVSREYHNIRIAVEQWYVQEIEHYANVIIAARRLVEESDG